MTKETHYFIVLVMMLVLIVVVFTLCFAYSLFPGKEQAPRRSRPVIGKQEAVFDYRPATDHFCLPEEIFKE